MWYRKASNEVNEACRHYIMDELKQREVKLDFQKPISVNKSLSEVYQIETTDSAAEARIIQFPRAS
jgi:hypothetical protein